MFARALKPATAAEMEVPSEAGLLFMDSELEAPTRASAFDRRHGFGIAAVLVLGAVALWDRGVAHRTRASAGLSTGLAESETCSGSLENCGSTKCCRAAGKGGLTCYAKSDQWAQCLEGCTPGVHDGETQGSYDASGQFVPEQWSCKELGKRGEPDPCSAPGEDCRKTQCCSAERGGSGMTCFEKDHTWASCATTCDPKDWSCKQLGNRTKFSAGCAWAGDSCADTHLCCNTGFACAVKDAAWTACTQTQKVTTWVTLPVPIPSDWQGTVLGGSRAEYEIPAAGEGEAVAGTSLYCFMAYLPDSYEVTLMDTAKDMKASVFACDDSDVFKSWQSSSQGWDTGEATLSNTDVFINVWDNLRQSGKYLQHDWTVKVDADAVLVPDRLKSHLAGLRPPAYRAIYIKNNKMDKGMGNNGFLGAVEVFSQQAVQIYFDNAEGCHKALGVNAGEDGYFKGCMDAIGVGFMMDGELFFPDRSPGACVAGQRAAFHPLKTPQNWRCCVDMTRGINHQVDYGNCIV